MRGKNAVKFFLVIFVTAIMAYLTIYGATISVPGWVGIDGNKIKLKSANESRFGIDINGGASITFSPVEGETPTDEEIDSVVKQFELRLDNKQIYDRVIRKVTSSGDVKDRVVVEVPYKSAIGDVSIKDANALVAELGEPAILTFREFTYDEETKALAPSKEIIVHGKDVERAYTGIGQDGKSVVQLEFNEEATKSFAEATERLAGTGMPIGIFLDEEEISRPMVNDKIPNGKAVITMGGSDAKTIALDAKDLTQKIQVGSLPIKLETSEVQNISSSLGEDSKIVTVKAGIVSLVLVWIFMLLYYRLPGMLANIALVTHVTIQLLFISWMEITLTLPGIAGIILSIGMGVDANVIIFERIKEEIKKGKTLKSAIDVGFKRAFTAILDANVTTLITSVVLFSFGSGPVRSFAITLGLGVLLSFLTAVLASRTMLRGVSDINIAKRPWLYGA